MRVRALALAATTGLVLALAPTAAQAAPKPTYKVSISTNTTAPTVGTTVKVTGKIAGPKAAKKKLLVQRKVGTGAWKTVAKVRTSTKRTYSARVRVLTAGQQYVRVVAPKSTKAKAGSSSRRGFVGWRWLDLTKQPNEKSGTVVNGPVTIAGKTYPKALTFAYSGIYFNTAGKCTTLRGSVGAPDAEAGELLVISIPTTADEEAQEFRTAAPAGAAPKAASYSVTKRPMIAFGHGDAEGRVSFVSPEVRCSVNALSAVPEELSPR